MKTSLTAKYALNTLVAVLSSSAVAYALPTIQVVSPTAGQSLTPGTTFQVAWNCTETSGYADIYLDKYGVPYAAIKSVPLADGKADWEICASIGDGTDYSVRIVRDDHAGGTLEASSGLFTITGSIVPPGVAITAPAPGAVWTNGASASITWTSTNPSGYVNIDLMKNGVFFRTIGYALTSARLFKWIPNIPDGSDYSIRIWAEACGPVPDVYSGNFTIQGSTAPSITVTRPSGGEIWTSGTTEAITFATTNVNGPVRIDLMKAGQWHAYMGTAAGSQMDWVIGENIGNSSDYTLRMSTYDSVVSDSASFSITASFQPPSIQLTNPLYGDIWAINRLWMLSWQSSDITGPVTLWLVKGGELYSCFGSVDVAIGSYTCSLGSGLPPDFNNQFYISSVGTGPLATDISGLVTTFDAPSVGMFSLNQGSAVTEKNEVTLDHSYVEMPSEYMISESSDFSGASWRSYAPNLKYKLSPAPGVKTVYFKIRNAAGESLTVSDTINYAPVVPSVSSLAINGGVAVTNSQNITLNNSCSHYPVEYMASESPDFTGASWKEYATAPLFKLSTGEGTKTVYFKVRNDAGESASFSDTITYSTIIPCVTYFAINNGADTTSVPNVSLYSTALNSPMHYMASESPDFSGASWMSYANTLPFSLSAGLGIKQIYFKVKNAYGESETASDTIVFISPPVISGFTPGSGQEGTVVTITGMNFLDTVAVLFNNVPAASFTVHSSSQITAVVPTGTTTGPIGIKTQYGTFFSGENFIIPKVIYVSDATGNDSYSGLSWAKAKKTIQAGLAAAVSGDQVWAAKGIYKPTDSTNRLTSFVLQSGIHLYGGFAGNENPAAFDLDDRDLTTNASVLTGDIGTVGVATDNSYHVVVGANNSRLDGFTITGGYANGRAPHNCGGGIYCSSASPTLANNLIVGNTATMGGNGGGIYCSSGSPTITNNVIAGNTTTGSGGGIYCSSASPAITNNSCIANSATIKGGAVCCYATSSPVISNTIIAFNSSGIDQSGGTGIPALRYNNVYGNTAYNYSGITEPTGTNGNISVDPRFIRNASAGADGTWGTVDDDYGDLRLMAVSPCIDAGSNADVPSGILTDLAGLSRFIDDPAAPDTGSGTAPIVDMGAYEMTPATPGDGNRDDHVDSLDFDLFSDCYSGPIVTIVAGCHAFDFNGDQHVDAIDFDTFSACYNGPVNPPGCR